MHSFDALEGSLQPSIPNISPFISFNSEHFNNTCANKFSTASLLLDIKAAILERYMQVCSF
jgi:hypothetical protein